MMRIPFIWLLLLAASSCKTEPQKVTLTGDALGTSYQVQFYSDERFAADLKLDSVIHAINRSMSTYIPDSDISRINRGDTTVVVDQMFRDVFTLSRKIYKKTNGYFDPTVGILVNAYGFGPERPLNELDSTTLDSLRQFVGFDKLTLSPEGTIKKEHPAIYLDFNSIAKGYCVDRIAAMLEENGVTDYLVEIGGELYAKGENLDKGKPWIVGIEDVSAAIDNRTYSRAVKLEDNGMAGSGNYRKYRVDPLTGQQFVHTINPLTGKAEKSDVLSATTIAESCAEADGYATAFMALGSERSKEVVRDLEGVEAYLQYAPKNSLQIYISEGFEKFIVEEDQ